MMALCWIDRAALAAAPPRRAAARALLEDTARVAGLEAVTVVRRDGAKPVLAAPGHDYSMSHSGTLSICVVADAPVGVDVEMLHVPRAARLAAAPPARFFTLRERDEIARDPAAVLRIFTFKEAWVKREGVGLGVGIGGFDRETLRVRHPDVAFTTVPLPGAVATVCHPAVERVEPRRARLSAAAIARAAAQDRKERAACSASR